MFVNGVVKPVSEVAISPLDHGFLYGAGFFETFRTYDGHPFLFDDHWARLRESAEALQMCWPWSKQSILAGLKQLLELEKTTNAYIRLTVTAGNEGIGISNLPYQNPNVFMYSKPLSTHAPTVKRGHFLRTRRSSPEGSFRMKSHHYLNNIFAKQELSDSSDEGIFLDESGSIAEGILSNVFWVKGGCLLTPSLPTGALNGITRQFILALCEHHQIPVRIGEFPKEALLEAEEAFVTNSVQEIVPLTGVDDARFATGPETIATQLHSLYKEYTHRLWGKNGIEK
ncbi:aminodeoxychorismate lyase [Bacillaceae bacterium SIJ1]|uniref:aminodeoxychorismate lyase n=1 Tax=Litoribacterium kuwaitense TaxID=1398745 RepID=UPI0013EB0812|nr:aminodeoxychorismate lyase [Litoribacterium kuwaitense]NGP45820.1 aminodeoxychorismate lyase [Litoribacterium kuwaitense]